MSASVEVSADGKAMKFYEVAPFALHADSRDDQGGGADPEHGKRAGGGAAMRIKTSRMAIICAAVVIAIAIS